MIPLMDVDDDVEPHDERRRQQRVYPLQDWAWEVRGHEEPASFTIPNPPRHGLYLRPTARDVEVVLAMELWV